MEIHLGPRNEGWTVKMGIWAGRRVGGTAESMMSGIWRSSYTSLQVKVVYFVGVGDGNEVTNSEELIIGLGLTFQLYNR